MDKKSVLEEAKQAGYNNDYEELARLLIEKGWVGEMNIQKAYIKGLNLREKELKKIEKELRKKK